MNGSSTQRPPAPTWEALQGHSNGHLKTLFDYYADQVDHQIQTGLVAELMARYAELSRQLEQRNRQLTHSDAMRLEAQRVALLGNWDLELATRALTWSETMYEILELPPDTKPTMECFMRMIHPEDAPLTDAVTLRLLEGKTPPVFTFRLSMPDGRIKWVQAHYVPVQSATGTVTRVRGSLQDITAAKEAEEKLQRYNTQLEQMVQEKVQEVFASQMATIFALVKLAESRDDDTGEHIERTSQYCQFIAEQLKLNSPYAAQIDHDFIRNIGLASPLHDIGKVGIPDGILLKPGKLTPDEFMVMKTHVTIGYETLASVEKVYPGNGFLRMGMDITRYHHEKWNGNGYQEGLSGTEIPLSARIMAVSDVYDALRSRRVYKEPFTHEKSLELMWSAPNYCAKTKVRKSRQSA